MTKDELIAKQALIIEELSQRLTDIKRANIDIYYILYSIGGPLNDNKLKYTKEQRIPFAKIAELIDY